MNSLVLVVGEAKQLQIKLDGLNLHETHCRLYHLLSYTFISKTTCCFVLGWVFIGELHPSNTTEERCFSAWLRWKSCTFNKV